MKTSKVYQALEYRGNSDDVEKHGPYECSINKWLGDGYYFWDSFIECSHWWGHIRYKSKGKDYIIAEAVYSYDDDTCFDLVGNVENIRFFRSFADRMIKEKIINSYSDAFVPHVIEYIKTTVKTFTVLFDSIRTLPSDTISSKNRNALGVPIMKYENSARGYFEMTPPIQICIFPDKIEKVKDFKVIYESVESEYLGFA